MSADIRDGVRHVDDEQASVNDIEDTGLWDHTEFTKRFCMHDLLESFKRLP